MRLALHISNFSSQSSVYYGSRRGVTVGVIRRMNEVTLRQAQLVLGWVTFFRRVYHHGT